MKPVKAWAVVTAGGKLDFVCQPHFKQHDAELHFCGPTDRMVRVEIREVPPRPAFPYATARGKAEAQKGRGTEGSEEAAMTHDGGPAFPVSTRPCVSDSGYGHQDSESTWQFGGMTLRDWFATHAPYEEVQHIQRDSLASGGVTLYQARYAWADAMLKAREQGGKG